MSFSHFPREFNSIVRQWVKNHRTRSIPASVHPLYYRQMCKFSICSILPVLPTKYTWKLKNLRVIVTRTTPRLLNTNSSIRCFHRNFDNRNAGHLYCTNVYKSTITCSTKTRTTELSLLEKSWNSIKTSATDFDCTKTLQILIKKLVTYIYT